MVGHNLSGTSYLADDPSAVVKGTTVAYPERLSLSLFVPLRKQNKLRGL
jgi:hypothetical protein